MILYFSGTGNSAYVAKKIGQKIGDTVADLFEKIRTNDFSKLQSDRPWIIVAPTYAWRIPHILQEWLKNTELQGNKDLYFVLTCGGSIGNAGSYLKQLAGEKNMNYCGCLPLVMPENYIAMFSTPTKEEALNIIAQEESEIAKAAVLIQKGESFQKRNPTMKDKMSSGIVNKLFYPLFVHARKFYATDRCISCGKCAVVCPLNNIKMRSDQPEWGTECTHCMACINHCPTEAIEYGKHSKGLPRYTCPK